MSFPKLPLKKPFKFMNNKISKHLFPNPSTHSLYNNPNQKLIVYNDKTQPINNNKYNKKKNIKTFQKHMHQLMNKTFDNNKTSTHRIEILSTLHQGFNSFYDVSFPSTKGRSRNKFAAKRIMSFTTYNDSKTSKEKEKLRIDTTFEQSCPILADTLRTNKSRLGRVKTQVQTLRNLQFGDYIKKSMRQQQLLNLNQNKKKHLPTLNTKIGQIVKKPTIEAITKNISYHLTSQKLVLQGWKPESRQGHTCVMYKGSAIVIGGHCSHPFGVIQVYSVDKNLWMKQSATQLPRSYHTSIIYKNRFIITFGGMGAYDLSRKSRSCFNNVSLLDLSTFTTRQLRMHNQDSIQGRRSHSAILMSKNMLVFGGMNSKKQYLSDLVYLDLKQLRWYHKQYKVEGKELGEWLETGLARHKAIAVFSKQRKHLPLYAADYMQHQGMYIFGGVFGNTQQNILMQCQFNKYNPSIRKVDYSGAPPSPIDPIVEHYGSEMVLVISGEQKQREIKIFKAVTRQFVAVDTTGGDMLLSTTNKLLGGIGSTVNEFEGRFYVFFGLGQQGYVGNVSRFSIQERVKENQVQKKKKVLNNSDRLVVNGEVLEWRQSRVEMMSSDDESDGREY